MKPKFAVIGDVDEKMTVSFHVWRQAPDGRRDKVAEFTAMSDACHYLTGLLVGRGDVVADVDATVSEMMDDATQMAIQKWRERYISQKWRERRIGGCRENGHRAIA